LYKFYGKRCCILKVSKKKVFAVCLLALWIFLWFINGAAPTSGREVLDFMPTEDITEITIRKVKSGREDFGTVTLYGEEIERFYKVISEAKIKYIGSRSIRFYTDVRYYVSLNGPMLEEPPIEIIEITIQGDEYLNLCMYGQRPLLDRRYAIISSSLNDFFDSIF